MSKETHQLYNGTVEVTFDEDAPRYRYIVNGKPVRGVTTVLSEIIDKPGLRAYAANQAMQYLFGAKWSEDELKYLYDESTASLRPDTGYTANQLQLALNNALEASTKRRDEGADTGKKTHFLIEKFLSETDEPSVFMKYGGERMPKEVGKAYFAFVDWFNEVKPKVLAVEQVVYSREMDYCGRFDCLLEIDIEPAGALGKLAQSQGYKLKKIVMVDIKTTNPSRIAPDGIYAENFLQLGGYSQAYHEEFTKRIINSDYPTTADKRVVDDLMVINCSKSGKVSTKYASELGLSVRDCEDLFVKAVDIHNFLDKYQKALKRKEKK